MSRSCVSHHHVVDRRRRSHLPSRMPIPSLPRRARRVGSYITSLSLAATLRPALACAQQSAPRPANPALAEMQGALDSVMHKQPIDFTAYSRLTEASRRRVLELIALDALR